MIIVFLVPELLYKWFTWWSGKSWSKHINSDPPSEWTKCKKTHFHLVQTMIQSFFFQQKIFKVRLVLQQWESWIPPASIGSLILIPSSQPIYMYSIDHKSRIQLSKIAAIHHHVLCQKEQRGLSEKQAGPSGSDQTHLNSSLDVLLKW